MPDFVSNIKILFKVIIPYFIKIKDYYAKRNVLEIIFNEKNGKIKEIDGKSRAQVILESLQSQKYLRDFVRDQTVKIINRSDYSDLIKVVEMLSYLRNSNCANAIAYFDKQSRVLYIANRISQNNWAVSNVIIDNSSFSIKSCIDSMPEVFEKWVGFGSSYYPPSAPFATAQYNVQNLKCIKELIFIFHYCKDEYWES